MIAFAKMVLQQGGTTCAAAIATAAVAAMVPPVLVLLALPLMNALGLTPVPSVPALGMWFGPWLTAPSLEVALALFGAASLAYVLVAVWQARTALALSHRIMLSQRRGLAERALAMPWPEFTAQRGADFLDLFVLQSDRVGAAARTLVQMLGNVMSAALLVTIAMMLAPAVTAAVLVFGLALTGLLARFRRRAADAGDAITAADQQFARAATDLVAGMKIIRSFGFEPRSLDGATDAARRLNAAYMRRADIDAIGRFVFDAGAVLMLVAAVVAAIRGGVAPASVLVLVLVFLRVAPHLGALAAALQNFRGDLASFKRVSEFMSRSAGLPAQREPHTPAPTELRFERVHFDYAGREAALQDVSLSLRAGETVAIVGASGAGKSTIADLALGLLPPRTGRVLVDGRAIGDVAAAWRLHVGYVPQDTFLFHDTVRANLCWAAPEAGDETLRDALMAAGAAFVFDLPRGLDTIVGDRGVMLSGGERQRIALARALIRRPAFLVLDEATSALDSESERVVQSAVDAQRGRVGMLVIAHRLSTIADADMILVLESGRIVERGRWDELVVRPGGRFRALCRAQGVPVEPRARRAIGT